MRTGKDTGLTVKFTGNSQRELSVGDVTDRRDIDVTTAVINS